MSTALLALIPASDFNLHFGLPSVRRSLKRNSDLDSGEISGFGLQRALRASTSALVFNASFRLWRVLLAYMCASAEATSICCCFLITNYYSCGWPVCWSLLGAVGFGRCRAMLHWRCSDCSAQAQLDVERGSGCVGSCALVWGRWRALNTECAVWEALAASQSWVDGTVRVWPGGQCAGVNRSYFAGQRCFGPMWTIKRALAQGTMAVCLEPSFLPS